MANEPKSKKTITDELLDERCEVGDVLPDAALSGCTLAFAVSASVIGDNSERLAQARHDEVPAVVRHPRPMYQDERHFPSAADLIREPDAVHTCRCHVLPFPPGWPSWTRLASDERKKGLPRFPLYPKTWIGHEWASMAFAVSRKWRKAVILPSEPNS